MTEKGLTRVEEYLSAVHPPGEADTLVPNDELRAFLAGIPVPKAILTNSPREHADAVLKKLELGDLFTHIFDIRQCRFLGKPRREFYQNALEVLGVSANDVLFIDDTPGYVEGFIAVGGRALLLDEDDIHADCPLPRIRNFTEITHYLHG
jgi:putative hydrolase of the HAD superfamily